jgi:peptidoglycan/xylan/chitin deacetylase (PgdA/CDA1 family)
VPRILDLLGREGIKGTFYIPGHTIESYPDLCRRIVDEGHEVGHHGYLHESPVHLTPEEERRVLERGLEACDTVLNLRPTGYRSPAWDLSASSVDLLLEYGFEYDSSMMAQDFEPYRCRKGDVPHTDRAFEFGAEVDLVEFPVSWTLDDFPQMEFNIAPYLVGLSSHLKAREMWLGDFDYMRQHVPDGAFGITFHPQVIGRGVRMTLLADLIAHMKQHDAAFKTVSEVVRAWKSANPLEAASATR